MPLPGDELTNSSTSTLWNTTHSEKEVWLCAAQNELGRPSKALGLVQEACLAWRIHESRWPVSPAESASSRTSEIPCLHKQSGA